MERRKGFTIVELLTVIAVMSLLLGLLIPSLKMARDAARVAKQRVQFSAIDQALLAFRNDDGDYPPSEPTPAIGGGFYCGAQKLAEALFGLDLLGFYPDTVWNGDLAQYTNPVSPGSDLSLRKPRYLELDSVDVVRVRNLYNEQIGQLAGDTYVLCDVFGRMQISEGAKIKKVGPPILYFRADPSKPYFSLGQAANSVYNIMDNLQIVITQQQFDVSEAEHLILQNFYRADYKILDKKVLSKPWPHKPDSYILISAGIDGLYGTGDDITSFGY